MPAATAEQRRFAGPLTPAQWRRKGLTVYEYEWWHFDHRDWNRTPIPEMCASKAIATSK